jgi:hypothetical protein
VVRQYGSVPLRDLLTEIVYKTPPMKAVKQLGETLPMQMLDNVDRNRLGVDFEEILAAERDVRAGNCRSAWEVLDELRAEHVASG